MTHVLPHILLQMSSNEHFKGGWTSVEMKRTRFSLSFKLVELAFFYTVTLKFYLSREKVIGQRTKLQQVQNINIQYLHLSASIFFIEVMYTS